MQTQLAAVLLRFVSPIRKVYAKFFKTHDMSTGAEILYISQKYNLSYGILYEMSYFMLEKYTFNPRPYFTH